MDQRSVGTGRDGRILLTATLGALAFGILARGAFFPDGKVGFAGLAGLAALAAFSADEPVARRALRSPVALVLLAVALVSAASASWTLGDSGAALRAGLVAAGCAGLYVAGAVIAASPGGPRRIVLMLVGLAMLAAILGLIGVGFRTEPWAERIRGAWRPGGSLEYPPGLAMLQVVALPFLLREMVSGSWRWAAPATAGAAAAAAVLALSGSRAGIALALLVMAAAIAWPRAAVGSDRRVALAAAGLIVASGLVAEWLAGGPSRGGHDEATRVIGLLGVLVATPLAWRALRGPLQGALRPGLARAIEVAVVLGCAVAVVVGLTTLRSAPSPSFDRSGGITHGRLETWRAAAETAAANPGLGVGAEGFLEGSREYQDPPLTRYAHSLPLEWWAELGATGLVLALALYASAITMLIRSRGSEASWLLGPVVIAFLTFALLDWPWHLAGLAGVFAVALGGLSPARSRV